MTWFSFSSKFLNILLILPLILSTFDENELTVYFIFITIIGTSNILDFGFKSTFVRIFSFASAGLDTIDIIDNESKKSKINGINWLLTERIFSAMKKIYLVISILLFLILSTLGTLLVTKSINLNQDTYNNASLAQAALQAEAWPLARQAINLIPEKNWTKSVYLMMADLDKKEHGDNNKYKFWQDKSLNALLDFSWGCTSCSYISKKWGLICPECSGLDSIQWQQFSSPSKGFITLPSNTQDSKPSIKLIDEDAARGIIKELNTGIDR